MELFAQVMSLSLVRSHPIRDKDELLCLAERNPLCLQPAKSLSRVTFSRLAPGEKTFSPSSAKRLSFLILLGDVSPKTTHPL